MVHNHLQTNANKSGTKTTVSKVTSLQVTRPYAASHILYLCHFTPVCHGPHPTWKTLDYGENTIFKQCKTEKLCTFAYNAQNDSVVSKTNHCHIYGTKALFINVLANILLLLYWQTPEWSVAILMTWCQTSLSLAFLQAVWTPKFKDCRSSIVLSQAVLGQPTGLSTRQVV